MRKQTLSSSLLNESLDTLSAAALASKKRDAHGQLGGHGTSDSLDLLSFLVSDKSGHSLDSLLLSNLLRIWRQHPSPNQDPKDAMIRGRNRLIDNRGRGWESGQVEIQTHLLFLNVNFDELDTWEFVFELGKMGRDHLARTAPCRPEVNDDGFITVDLR
jgi:hypothetical protein